ncbi:YicC family protein [bacterium]|nr:YicC family protein [bacterium]
MSIKSMTGFAKITEECDYGKISLEIYSINHKYFDVQLTLPRILSSFEYEIRKKISSLISRGKVRVVLVIDSNSKQNFVKMKPDLAYAEAYLNALEAIKEKFNVKGEVDISIFQGNRDLLVSGEMEIDNEKITKFLLNMADKSVAQLFYEQEKEAEKLVDDMNYRINNIADELSAIESLSENSPDNYRERLIDRINELKLNGVVDEDRIAKEVAFFCEKIDICEELVRAKTHISNFTRTINKGGLLGKKLDFICQEIFREINTIASKSNNAEVTTLTIKIKSQLDKIREQVQNIQ